MESRTQGSRSRARTQKNPRPRPRTSLPRADPLEAKDRNARGQGQGHWRNCFAKKRFSKNFSGEKGLKNFFFDDLQLTKTKKGLRKFSARSLAFSNKISTVERIVLSSSRGQSIFEDLRLRGQGQGLDLRGQGQELQNMSSRTSSRPRTFSRTSPLELTLWHSGTKAQCPNARAWMIRPLFWCTSFIGMKMQRTQCGKE